MSYWSGQEWQLGTAAYWESVAHRTPPAVSHRLGASLAEEIGICMLGGYGIPSALANAAFLRLRQENIFVNGAKPTAYEIEALLRQPFPLGSSERKYRFPRQKAHRLSAALKALTIGNTPTDELGLRDWLLLQDGIGPKTASWIVRNTCNSDKVAIIDIHIIRAGVAAGVFSDNWSVAGDYELYEQAFLQWAQHAQLRASHFDACIWASLAYHPEEARDILGVKQLSDSPSPVWPAPTPQHGEHRGTLQRNGSAPRTEALQRRGMT